MKSIRRTLIFNVTALLVLAVGTISVLVYAITKQAIVEKQQLARELVTVQLQNSRDQALLSQALALSNAAKWMNDPSKFHYLNNASSALAVALMPGPNAHVTTPLWLAEHMPGRNSHMPPIHVRRMNFIAATDLKFNESEELTYGYVQVNSDWGKVWRSDSLAGRTMSLDETRLNSEQPLHPYFDNVEIAEGVTARRVSLKAPLTKFERVVGPRGQSMRTPPPTSSGLPAIYIQVAWDSTNGDPRLGNFEQQHEQQLHELDEKDKRALSALSQKLAWISGGSLAIIVVGGWLLIGSGLSPLKRLSIAVGKVSAKNFKLPIEPRDLPKEVLPVSERLKQTLQQLQEAFAREKRASADISHELRTPLAALTTTLEVALRKPRSSEDYRQTIEDSRQIARQMSLLVERMLMLAWLDAGADEIHSQAVDVDQIVAGCAAIGKPLAEAQGLRFQVTAESPLTVQTDPDKLREVVMNLLHNAIEYNRPGGEVEITARSGVAGGIEVEVRDTGIGIPAELHEKIFERFYRGDPSRNAAGVHAGLGLAIVKEYVDRLGGRLSIESAVGTGSSFRLVLPNL